MSKLADKYLLNQLVDGLMPSAFDDFVEASCVFICEAAGIPGIKLFHTCRERLSGAGRCPGRIVTLKKMDFTVCKLPTHLQEDKDFDQAPEALQIGVTTKNEKLRASCQVDWQACQGLFDVPLVDAIQ